MIGVICATLPIIASCVTVGIITSVNNYPASIPDAVNFVDATALNTTAFEWVPTVFFVNCNKQFFSTLAGD